MAYAEGVTRGARLLVLLAAAAALLAVAAVALAGRPGGGPVTLQFSGYEWTVKSSSRKIGPGPNFFSTANAWVDANGALHLRIAKSGNRWQVAEVISKLSFGYGTYTWELGSAVHALDPNVVLGLFTWNDDPAYNHRELDIEFADWGNPADTTNGQFVVQPYSTAGNLVRFTQPPGTVPSTQSVTWRPGSVAFASTGVPDWTYSGPDVPVPGGENARMNLWLFRGQPPTNGEAVEIVIRSFTFTPLTG